jgi:PAS domain S-box-containing protein
MLCPCGAVSLPLRAPRSPPAAFPPEERRPHAGPVRVNLERRAVDGLAQEIRDLVARLRPVIQTGPGAWPRARGQVAAALARDIAAAVQALDVAVEALYFQTDSLEAAHRALEVERRAYREQFEQGPDGHLVTDPDGMIIRANLRAGEMFVCPADNLVGQPLPALVSNGARASLEAAIEGLALTDWEAEWIGLALRAHGPPFQLALTAAVVRHGDGSVYRVQWSLRDISRRPSPD